MRRPMLCSADIMQPTVYGGKRIILFAGSTSHSFACFLKGRCSFWHRPICRNLHRTSHSFYDL